MDMDPNTAPPASSGLGKSSTGMDANVAAGIAVLFGWISGLIFFLIEKDSKFVKFWAFQAILLSAIGMVLGFIPFVNIIAGILLLIVWIICLVNAFSGKVWKLPVLGNIAAQQSGLNV